MRRTKHTGIVPHGAVASGVVVARRRRRRGVGCRRGAGVGCWWEGGVIGTVAAAWGGAEAEDEGWRNLVMGSCWERDMAHGAGRSAM